MQNLEIRETKNKGKGLYSLVHFAANQVILKLNGIVINSLTVNKLEPQDAALVLQIGNDKYLDLDGELGYFINHSCNPNAAVKIIVNTAFLVSTRAILPNEELCFDYSTTSTDTASDWSMACNCGQWNCRQLISGFKTLNIEEQEKYVNDGLIPSYISSKKYD